MPLESGDILFIGTPQGVVFGEKAPPEQCRWLRAGNKIASSIVIIGARTPILGAALIKVALNTLARTFDGPSPRFSKLSRGTPLAFGFRFRLSAKYNSDSLEVIYVPVP